ncbi:MAG: hypothetical protein JNK85_23650 [Verrucomicrobiales bacterium]|nr:hypothetical protein [Verrucomicrobiales bacterium]
MDLSLQRGFNRRRLTQFLAAVGLVFLSLGVVPADTPAWPTVSELQTLLRSQLPSVPEASPGETNAGAYLKSLAPWVLVGEERPSRGGVLSRTNVYGDGIAYLRVNEVQIGLSEAIASALANLGGTSRIHGVILDLRFTGGADFREAAAAAGVLTAREPSGFRMGTTEIEGRSVPTSFPLPTIILVNRQTRGAAEALAAATRHLIAPSLVIGTNTSGQARSYRPVPVPGGAVIRVAGDPFTLPSGTSIPPTGLEPDLQVAVSEEDEAIYFTDEFRRVFQGKPVTAEPSFRLNEAELVRRRRGPRSTGDRASGTPARVVHDPVLARGVDLLESLAARGDDAGNSR